ncbi:efflux transporter outer membrane subunit [Aquabacterium sp.]|uniref:efflux transporter outer membrane subunit n=1 Tax=Aquabacterium sp. TaxID=1872578 RepID=UPI0035AFD465
MYRKQMTPAWPAARRFLSHRFRLGFLSGVALVLAGCAAVGPDYQAPQPAAPAQWAERDTAVNPNGAGDLTRWWTQLGDAQLTSLIDEALQGSTDLRLATARLREARARRALAGDNAWPTLSASASASRTKSSAAATGSGATRSLYNAGFDASWEPDLFGGTRRAIEAAQADLDTVQANLHATQVSLVAEVALNYVELRAYQERLALAQNNLANQTETWQIAQWRVQAGLAGSLDAEQARSNMEQTRAQLPVLRTNLAEAEHRLAVLLGRTPASLHERLAATAALPTVPEQIGVGIPAQTLAQRPDVRAAERKLAAETARVGQASAARYPQLTLSGSIGLQALQLDALHAPGAVTRSLVGQLAAPIFDAGRIREQIEIQNAVQEQALVNYEASVNTALREVEDALVALANNRQRQTALAQAAEAAHNAALLAHQQYTSGLIDFQTVLSTERTQLSVDDSLASARADSVSAVIQLYKALGGGWSPQPTP